MQLSEWLDRARDFLRHRAQSYRKVFAGPLGEVVLKDLARFCRAHASTHSPDPHIAARLDGRREVWLRIQHHLALDDEALWKLYGEKGAQR